MIQTKRVYDPMTPYDDERFLVERLWPCGMKNESLQMDAWLKDIAPSDELHRWFSHDLAKKRIEFRRRYVTELNHKRRGRKWCASGKLPD